MAGPPPTLGQLRPALQLALDVASASPGPLPGRVRSVVRSRRLPANWQASIRQALEEDDSFRVRVAAGADEDGLGRLAWLWLVRPEGWAEQLDELVQLAIETEEREQEARAAAGRIAELESDLARAVSSAGTELAAARHEHERALAAVGDRLQEARTEARKWAAEAGAAREQVSALTTENAGLQERVGELLEVIDGLERQVAELTESRDGAAGAAERAGTERAALEQSRAATEAAAARLRSQIGAAVGRAAGAARDLGEALAEAAAAFAVAAPPGGPVPPVPGTGTGTGTGTEHRPAAAEGRLPPPGPPGPGAAVSSHPANPATRRPAPTATPAGRRHQPPTTGPQPRPAPRRRRPLPLPPAVFEESAEAADYLVRSSGAQLVIDGYNVTFSSWSGHDLPALRHRLISALSELAVRVKRRIIVVFDGTDSGGRIAAPPVARPWLRILFSASSVEADEVIVETVETLRPSVPVVVVTNDRQIRSDVQHLGANVLSVEQLLGVLGRQPAG